VLQRLALSYAPARAREPWLALLALDARLAGIVRNSHEPMLAQIRLAWWRENFRKPLTQAPAGEPLLGLLAIWEREREALVLLVDGWEALIGQGPLKASSMLEMASGRGRAFGALARMTGAAAQAEAAAGMATVWALADLAAKLGSDAESGAARSLLAAHELTLTPLPRAMRPLAVLHGLARRASLRGERLGEPSPGAFATALRLGLLGR